MRVWHIEEKIERLLMYCLTGRLVNTQNKGLNISLRLEIVAFESFRLLRSQYFHMILSYTLQSDASFCGHVPEKIRVAFSNCVRQQQADADRLFLDLATAIESFPSVLDD